MGKAVSSVTSAAGKVVGQVTGGLFGGLQSGGLPGLGEYKPDAAQIDKAPFARQIAEDQYNKESRAIQKDLTERLVKRAKGELPSVAEKQIRAEADRQMAQLRGASAGQRGRLGALAQRAVRQQQVASGQELGRQAGILRGQEQAGYEQLLGGQVAQQRAQDVGVAEGDRESLQRFEEMKLKEALGRMGVQASSFESARGREQQLMQGIGSGIAMAASDKNAKKNVKSGKDDTQKFLDSLKAKSFEYKDKKKHGEGKRIGVMAQDVEAGSSKGKDMVVETNDGTKMIDQGKGFSAVLAALAELNAQVKKLESKKSKKA